jgi:hypothetical protein
MHEAETGFNRFDCWKRLVVTDFLRFLLYPKQIVKILDIFILDLLLMTLERNLVASIQSFWKNRPLPMILKSFGRFYFLNMDHLMNFLNSGRHFIFIILDLLLFALNLLKHILSSFWLLQRRDKRVLFSLLVDYRIRHRKVDFFIFKVLLGLG